MVDIINGASDLERQLSFYIADRLKYKLGHTIGFEYRKSPKSRSRYIYVRRFKKGVGIRISDHYGEQNLKVIRFYTKCRDIREFYLFTKPGFESFVEFFSLHQADE